MSSSGRSLKELVQAVVDGGAAESIVAAHNEYCGVMDKCECFAQADRLVAATDAVQALLRL